MRKIFFFMMIVYFFIGCANTNIGIAKRLKDNTSIAVEQILKDKKIDLNCKIIVTTVVKDDDLEKSSKIGRMITEQIIADLVNRGIKVVEIRANKDHVIYVKNKNGEFYLSRDAKKISNSKKACAILVGTYTFIKNLDSKEEIYVNLKLLDPKNSVIIGAADYVLDVN